MALFPAQDTWRHLFRFVIPASLLTTLYLVVFVSLLTTVLGIATAYLVSFMRFPGRRLLEGALLMPLAMPTYVIAYIYLDWFDSDGIIYQALSGFYTLFAAPPPALRSLPDIRSLGGAVFVMSSVLYPYVYMTCRASFFMQSGENEALARSLGMSSFGAFYKITLPLLRPALAIGLTLVIMETLNDLGAVKIYGLRTLTFSIYETWLNRNDLAGAAQIACIMLLMIGGLLYLERWGRRHQRFYTRMQQGAPHKRITLSKGWGYGATCICALPCLLGFFLPLLSLLASALTYSDQLLTADFMRALRNTFVLSLCAAVLTLLIGLFMANAVHQARSRKTKFFTRLACMGYAIPGTILALGVLMTFTHIDQALALIFQLFLPQNPAVFLTGGVLVLIYAYIVRFLALSVGTIETGFHHISPNLDAAARSLGVSRPKIFFTVYMPLLRPALISAGVLVFVECMKELPATLLLRPFDFETLSTTLYSAAMRDAFEEGTLAALAIVLAGLPVVGFLMHVHRRE